MARRLPVVVSQGSSGSVARRSLEESLITTLLLESGLDLNIVPHLPELSKDHTGLLCLEGIQGALVLVSWLPPTEAHSALSGIGIHGRLGRTAFDRLPVASAANGPRIVYAINLSDFDNPEPVSAEIRRIRDDLATPTLSILGFAAEPVSPVVSPPKPNGEPAPNPPVVAPSATNETNARTSDDDDPALQRLVDMLDEMDL